MKNSSNDQLHRLSEWEQCINRLPIVVTLNECTLDHGYVTQFKGTATFGKKKRALVWTGSGRCFYGSKRLHIYDVKFN